MGSCVAVPTFRRTYHVAKKHNANNIQRSIAERETYKVYYNSSSDVESSTWMAIKNRGKYTPKTNRIKTTRYNIITFLPKNIFEQFHRVANVYFAILIGL
ncbi:unnamed protein product, partial [Rotaria sp. Silwood2]